MSRAYLVTCDLCDATSTVPDGTALPYSWAHVSIHTVGLLVGSEVNKKMDLCPSCRARLTGTLLAAIEPVDNDVDED